MNYALFNSSKQTYFYFDSSHRKCETFDINRAELFDEIKAKNVLANQIAPTEQYRWEVIEIAGCTNINTCDTENISQNIADSEIMSELTVIMQAADKLNSYINSLESRLIDINRQQQDVLHYIEKYDLNACDGFKAYKLLKEIRMERRKIKNEIRKSQLFDMNVLGGINYGNAIKKMAELDSHTDYTPRVLSELFASRECPKPDITITSEKCG